MTARERTCAHEGGHAVAALLLGSPVTVVDVQGDANHKGFAHYLVPELRHREAAIDRMIVTLCGPLMGDPEDEIPTWPLRHDRTSDERTLAHLVETFDLTEHDYRRAVREALELTLDPEFIRMHERVSGMLGLPTTSRPRPHRIHRTHDRRQPWSVSPLPQPPSRLRAAGAT